MRAPGPGSLMWSSVTARALVTRVSKLSESPDLDPGMLASVPTCERCRAIVSPRIPLQCLRVNGFMATPGLTGTRLQVSLPPGDSPRCKQLQSDPLSR